MSLSSCCKAVLVCAALSYIPYSSAQTSARQAKLAFLPGVPTSLTSEVNAPRGLAVDADGSVYVADSGNGRILRISVSGEQQIIDVPGLHTPTAIAVDSTKTLYIFDAYSSEPTAAARILKRDAEGNIAIVTKGGAGFAVAAGAGDFAYTELALSGYANANDLVAMDGIGRTYYGSSSTGSIVRHDSTGDITLFHNPAIGIAAFAVDAAGTLYIADSAEKELWIVPADGSAAYEALSYSALSVKGGSLNAMGIDADGSLYFSFGSSASDSSVVKLDRTRGWIDFSTQTVGSPVVPQVINLMNVGDEELNQGEFNLSSAEFSVNGGSCGSTAFRLAKGASCTLSFGFSRASLGIASGEATAFSNSPNSPARISLSGVVVLKGMGKSNTTYLPAKFPIGPRPDGGLLPPPITWPVPASIVYGSPLSVVQLDATATGVQQVAFVPNVVGFSTDGTTVTGGFDGTGGTEYSSNQLGTSITWNGANYPLGAANVVDAISGGTVLLPAGTGAFSYLNLLGAMVNNESSNSHAIVVTYSDASTSSTTLTFSDWANVINYTSQSTVVCNPYRNTSGGGKSLVTVCVFGYQVPLTAGKTPVSVALPADRNIVFLAMGLQTTAIPGSFAYNPTAGTTLGAGSQTLNTTFTPTDTTTYSTATDSVSLTVNAQVPTIEWATPAPIPSGTMLSSTQLNATAVATTGMVQAPLAPSYRSPAIYSDGFNASGNPIGMDGSGDAYSGNLLGNSIQWNGIEFPLGPVDDPDSVTNTTVALPQMSFSTLYMVGAAGTSSGLTGQSFVINYTDGTSATTTLSISSWRASSAYSGETIVSTTTYGDTGSGGQLSGNCYVYGYSIPLNSAKTLQSITLPAILSGNKVGVTILAISLATPGATTVTVPGTYSYNPAAGTTPAVGTDTLKVTFTPTDAVDYSTATGSVQLVVVAQIATKTTISANPTTITGTSNAQQTVLTATVTPASTTSAYDLAGQVTFTVNGATIPVSGNPANLPGTTTTAQQVQITVPVSYLQAGANTLCAVYGGSAYYSGSTSSTCATVTVQEVVTSPNYHDFGAVTLGSTGAAYGFKITNGTTSATPVSLGSVQNSPQNDFTVANNCPTSLKAGASCYFNFNYAPPNTTIQFEQAAVTINLGAVNGTVTVHLAGHGNTANGVVLTTLKYDFGAVATGLTAAYSITVQNTNNYTIHSLTFAGLSAPFTVDNSAANACANTIMVAHQSCSYTVDFSPTAAVQTTENVTVSALNSSNAPVVFNPGGTTGATIQYIGTGMVASGSLTASTGGHNYGTVSVSTTSAAYGTTITNSTSGPLTITLGGGSFDTTHFRVTSNNCGASLASGAHCNLAFTFTPSATGLISTVYPISASANGTSVPLTTGGVTISGITLKGTGQ